MLDKPTNWDSIINNGGYIEFRAIIEILTGTEIVFTDSEVSSSGFVLEQRLFDSLSLGNAASAHLSFMIVGGNGYIPVLNKGQKCSFECRAVLNESSSGWGSLGTYYIDDVSVSADGDTASVSAFDEMTHLGDVCINFNSDLTLADYAQLLYEVDGTSIMIDSPLLDAVYVKPNAQTDPQTKPGYTLQELSTLTIPASMSGTSARDVIAMAAAFAAGNAIIDRNGLLYAIKIDRGSVVNDPGVITIEPSDAGIAPDEIDFNEVSIGSNASWSGYCIKASVPNDMVVIYDDVAKWDTSDQIKTAMLLSASGQRTYNVKEIGVSVSGVEVSPFIDLRDTVSFTKLDGDAITFQVNGFRLTCSNWCIGELSTQASIDDVSLTLVNKWAASTGWWYPQWTTVQQQRAISMSYSPTVCVFESDKSVLIKINLHSGVARTDGQKLTINFAYYYPKNSASSVANKSFDVYALEKVYSYGNGFIRFVGENLPVDIDTSRPYSGTIKSDGALSYQVLIMSY